MLLQEIYRALITSLSSSVKKNLKKKLKNSNTVVVIQIITMC